jgi:hypothetical protein
LAAVKSGPSNRIGFRSFERRRHHRDFPKLFGQQQPYAPVQSLTKETRRTKNTEPASDSQKNDRCFRTVSYALFTLLTQSVVAVMGVTLRASARRRSPSGPLAGHKPFPRERRVIQFNSVMTDAARRLEVFRQAILRGGDARS